ncbi:MAG TPA: iron-containing alcohol dehydrogenase [Thermoguttaceae bacterium]|nr:iron-containing alcohol dehydrogenase [Thermoguttaceae bacterium]
MLRNWEFQLPTRVRFGRGGLRKLGDVAGELGTSAFLVGYRDQSGLEETYARAAKSLCDAGMAVAEFFEVPPDPEAELGLEGARRLNEAGADVVVGLGGGSVIDAAKGIAALAKMGGNLWDYTGANPDSRPITKAVPLVAVPTTAGTGTEVSAVAVFTHHGISSIADMPLKASVSGPAVRPQVALVDPDLTVGSPLKLTAACGADALGHAIEACLSRRANPVSSLLAGRAVGLILRNLRRAVENPDDPEPREPLALAATLAGAAFSVAGVVVPHAISQALGGLLHVPHGLGVAIATPLSLRFNAACCVDEYAELAEFCGIMAASPERQAAAFVDCIVELLRSVGIPERVDVPPDAPDDLIDRLVRNARESTPVPITLNPRKIDDAALAQMFREVLNRK